MMGLLLLALAIGVVLPIQAGVNAQLGSALGHPIAAAVVLAPRLGAANLIATVVGGQMIASLATTSVCSATRSTP